MTIVFGGAAFGGIIGFSASESSNEDEAFLRSEGGEDLVRVALDLDLVPDFRDRAGLVDEEGRALDPEILPAVQVLQFPHVVCGRHLSLVVAQEREVEVVLVLELHMAPCVVAAHAHSPSNIVSSLVFLNVSFM